MSTVSNQRSLLAVFGCALAAIAWAGADQKPTPPAVTPVAVAQTEPAAALPAIVPLQIVGLADASGVLITANNTAASSRIGLDGKLWVVLNQPLTSPSDKYVLFLNGAPLKGLTAVTNTIQSNGKSLSALVFSLERNKDNDAFWKDLLHSVHSLHIPLVVSLGVESTDAKSLQPTIVGVPLSNASFGFEVVPLWRLLTALFAVIIVIALVWGHARTRTTLRDNLLPQIPPRQQTYSLGRWQMAFWFTLIFCAFIFLFVILGDFDTINAQALMLLGISGATALAAIAVDVAKDSPADAVNRGLIALGLKTYADVVRVQQEIIDRQEELAKLDPGTPDGYSGKTHGKHAPSPTEAHRKLLQSQIQDRNNVIRTYTAKIQPFLTQGWFKDITTDINGTTIHRLQAVCWTFLLGAVFVIEVYQSLAMPTFSNQLLLLMGISSAGYVGFKYPEVNS